MAISLDLVREFFLNSPNGDLLAKISIIAVSFLVMLLTTLVTKFATNQNRMKELKDIQKACQIKLKDSHGNPEEMKKINDEMMKCNLELMKHSFKPMLFTFIPLLILIGWMSKIFADAAAPVLKTWIWWYIISGLIFSIALKKILKVH